MHYNTGENPRLTMCDVNDEWTVVIDPDTMFWALVSNKRDLQTTIRDEVIPRYLEVKDVLAEEMRKFRFEVFPTAVYFNAVDRCNADCLYCYIPKPLRSTGRKMSTEEIRTTLHRLQDYFSQFEMDGRKPVVVFHGSEPLLVKDSLKEVIDEFDGVFHFGIQTNGTLLEQEDAEFIMERGVSIGLSLDSPDQKTNDHIRRLMGGGGTYEKVTRAIEWFDGYEGLNVVTTITKYNVEHLPQMVDFLHERGVRAALMNPVRGTQPPAVQARPDIEKLTKFFIAAVERAVELTRSSERPIVIGDYANLVLGIVAPLGRRLMCDITPCGGGRRFFAISADGNIVPCGEFIGFEEFRGGNVLASQRDIERALDSEPFRKVRARVVEHIEHCSTCAFRNICGAPCPAEVYAVEGDMMHKSPYCEFFEHIIRHAFVLIARGDAKYVIREDDFDYKYKIMA